MAQQLLGEFERTVGLLLAHPRLAAIWRHGRHRHLMRRFPYAIFYESDRKSVTVYGVLHTSRDPDKWRQRLM